MHPERTWLSTLILILLGAGLVAVGMVRALPKVYMAGVGLFVITVCVKAARESYRARSAVRLRAAVVSVVVIGLGVAAIVVPRNSAQALGDPEAIWSAPITEAIDMTIIDGGEADAVLLTHGGMQVGAHDLETGETCGSTKKTASFRSTSATRDTFLHVGSQ